MFCSRVGHPARIPLAAAPVCISAAHRRRPDAGADAVQEVGLTVADVVVLIDREQGGRAHLDKHGLQLHAAFTLSFIVDTLLAHKLLSEEVVTSVKTFIADNQTTAAVAGALPLKMAGLKQLQTGA